MIRVRTFWEEGGVRSAFADHYTVYAVERRGRGESGDADDYYVEREAEDVALPNSQIAISEGEQHMAIHTASDRFVDEVVTFIQESS